MNVLNIKLSIKTLLKNRVLSAINIGGLALGISISLLIFAFVEKEESMDQFISDSENIFVLLNYDDSYVSSKMVDLVRSEIPEIKHITYAKYEWSPQVFLEHNKSSFKVNNLIVSDSAFFRVLQMEALFGNPQEALTTSNKIVLSEILSKKIFGDINSVGKTIKFHSTNMQNELVEVGAVIKKLPHTSSFEFDAVLSDATSCKLNWYANLKKNWGTQNYYSFFIIPGNININTINEKLKNISLADVPDGGKKIIRFSSISLHNAYYNSPDVDIQKHGNQLAVAIVRIVGLLILLLAFINYINLVTAQKMKRLRTIGIIKALGSKRMKVIRLLSTESVLVLICASALVILLLNFLIEGLNHLTKSQFTLLDILSGWNLLIFVLTLLLALLLTGVIPGILLSKNETTLLLKNVVYTNSKNYLRNALLIFQFTISIILITSILFINKQNNFLTDMDPGFKRENIIYTTTNDDISKVGLAFIDEIKKIPGVDDLTFASAVFGYNDANWSLQIRNKEVVQDIGFANFYVTSNFFNFFGIDFIRGNQFNDYSPKAGDWIFNETAINKFGIDQLDDVKVLSWSGKEQNIIAEVEDFNFESLHVPIYAVGFKCRSKVDEVVYFKVNTANSEAFKQCLNSIQKVWDVFSPNFPLEIKFMNSSWESLYEKERQFQKIINYATIISLILSCLGLISLTIFVLETRTKEIGIRKINGAKSFEIIRMLNMDFIKWVAVAFIIACPIAWYAMDKWLENFAYKTELSWWIFALAGFIAMGIALLTVSIQSWRAATRNPVESLRYE